MATIDYVFYMVKPFVSWDGARQMVRSTIKKSIGNVKPEFWLPIPMAQSIKKLNELCLQFYGLTLTQLLGKGVRQNHYDCDTPLKKWYNDQMTKDFDVPNCKVPKDSFWFVVPRELKKNKTSEMKSAELETGWTQAELIAHAKKHPKTKK